MTIEIHTPCEGTNEQLITTLKKRVFDLYHFDKKISKAEIFLHESEDKVEKYCEIRLSIFRDSIFVSRKARSFQAASEATLNEVAHLVKERS